MGSDGRVFEVPAPSGTDLLRVSEWGTVGNYAGVNVDEHRIERSVSRPAMSDYLEKRTGTQQ